MVSAWWCKSNLAPLRHTPLKLRYILALRQIGYLSAFYWVTSYGISIRLLLRRTLQRLAPLFKYSLPENSDMH